MEADRLKIAEGFILAGGRSRRMGRDKALIEVGDETFLDRAHRALEPVCERVSLVLSEERDYDRDFPVVRDIFPGRGALGGIHAALANCKAKIAVILAVDLPNVTADAAANLIALAESMPKYLAVVPRQIDGRPQPLFAAYRARFCVVQLEQLINENPRASVRDFLDLINPKFIDQARLSENPKLLLNVNTETDLIMDL